MPFLPRFFPKALHQPLTKQYALFPWLTVIDNIAFGLRLAGVPKTERLATARRYLEMVNLGEFEDAYIKELSGGMKQRIAIARSLATDPAVLLMDEPFAAVDAMTRSMLQTELTDLQSRTGKTILFITHSIDEALLLSTRILVLSSRSGRVLELIDNPLPRPHYRDPATKNPWPAPSSSNYGNTSGT